MYGHWFSDNGTRKLNRHWQGEEILGFFNMYHVINDGLSILMPKTTDHLSVLMKKSTGHLSVLMKKSTITLASKMVKSSNRMSIKMNKITESGKIMYTTRGKGKFKKVAKSVATAGPFNIITNSGDAFKKLYDNEDLLSTSTTRFLGFQVSVIYCDKSFNGGNGFSTYELKNMLSTPNFAPLFFPIPSGDGQQYPTAGYMSYQPLSVDLVKFYNENCKHDLSQMGNTEYIGSDYMNTDYYGDFNMMGLIKSIEMLSITKDLNNDSVLKGTEVGTEEIVMKISNNDFNATGDSVQQRRIPIIGKSILGIPVSTGSGRCADLAYVFTPTVYDETGKIATLKR